MVSLRLTLVISLLVAPLACSSSDASDVPATDDPGGGGAADAGQGGASGHQAGAAGHAPGGKGGETQAAGQGGTTGSGGQGGSQAGSGGAGKGGTAQGGAAGLGQGGAVAGAGQGGAGGAGNAENGGSAGEGGASGAGQGGEGGSGQGGMDAGGAGNSAQGGDGQGGGEAGGSSGGAGSGGSVAACPVSPKTGAFAPEDALDFLVQDVCVDAQGKVTADDPATCPCRRDLGIDERLPYHKSDNPDGGNPFGFQISDSFPVRLAVGSIGALQTFDFGFGEVPNTHYRSFLEFDDKGGFGADHPGQGFPIDGYDLLEQNGAQISIVSTCDGGGGVQPIWSWKDGKAGACQLEDAWLLFDRNQVSAVPASATAHLRINNPSEQCPQDFLSEAYTEWQQRDVTYSTGKTLSTLVASHYGGAAPEEADHIERFYLTREYGKARWERWNLTPPPSPPSCNGDKQETHGSRTFYMIDCRDWTHVVADPRGGFEPRTWPVDLRAGRGNLVVNGDFGAATDYLGPWERFSDDVSWSIVEINDPTRLDHRNRHLDLSWNGVSLPSVHQDLANPSLAAGTTVAFGAFVWADAPSSVSLKVFQFDGGGALLSDATADGGAVGPTPQRLEGSFVVAAGAQKFRIELYQGIAGLTHHLDEVWLTPQ